ncbi:MAG TPA: Cys-tRNA(Pro) deacylase [Spirochaetia bacterium]|nr:Cys-tRNA(Pro) deacylase [Spirochaetia bacterium]
MTRTNAMRILDSLGIAFETAAYEPGAGHKDAVAVARELGVSPEIVFKTLVARTERNEALVFCIPGPAELDLKKAAKTAGARKVEMLPLAELTPVTGYQRGGCSPVGMKKKLRTWIDEMASAYERIYVNAGTRGMQVILSPADLCRAADAELADLI